MSDGGPHLVVTGLMGVGKSTVAEAVAVALGRPLRDSDRDIETITGVSGADVALHDGVDELHRLESAVLLGALADSRPLVISAAAWDVEDRWCRRALALRATTVVLTAPTEELLRRIPTGAHRRPMSSIEVEALAERRQPMFEVVADLVLPATAPVADIADRIVDHVRSRTTT